MAARILPAATRLQSNVLPIAATATVAGLGLYALNNTRAKQTNSPSPDGAAPVFSSGLSFMSLRLQSSELVTKDTKRLRFELPDANAKGALPLTAALLTISKPEGSWLPVARPYHPTTDVDATGHIELTVKHYPNGKQSTHLHSLKPGDSLLFAGPIKGYAWTPNQHERIGLVAGGMGITPIYQLVQGIMKNPDDRTRVTLVWGVNGDEDVFLQEEFKKLQALRPGQLDVHYVVSHPGEKSVYKSGRIGKEVLERAKLSSKDGVGKVLICGPPAFETAMAGSKKFGKGSEGVLAELGYTPAQIHKF